MQIDIKIPQIYTVYFALIWIDFQISIGREDFFFKLHPCIQLSSVLFLWQALDSTSSRHYKDGYHSLEWRWQPGGRHTLSLGRRLSGDGTVGVKIWIYRNQTSSSNLTISLVDSPELMLSYNSSLNFKGWRAAWVALEEAKSVPKNPGYDQIVFQAPMHADVIFVDLLCL